MRAHDIIGAKSLEIAMSSGSMHSWDPSIYPISLFGHFFGYYLCAHLLQLSVFQLDTQMG